MFRKCWQWFLLVMGVACMISGYAQTPSQMVDSAMPASPSSVQTESENSESISAFTLKEARQTSQDNSQHSSFLKMLLGLGLVILAIFSLAWLSRRLNMVPGAGQQLKIESALGVGAKEKVMIVEVDNKRLLLGVTPSQISLLQTLSNEQPKTDNCDPSLIATKESHSLIDFSTRLKSALNIKATSDD